MSKNKQFVISLGGSVLVSDEIDVKFLKDFCCIIKKEIKKGSKFVLVVGGGATARNYQKAASQVARVSNESKDWIGIYATCLNAQLVKAAFEKEANPILFDKRFKLKNFGKHSIIVGCGWQPGWSTDFDTVQVAVDFGIKTVVNLGKPDYVYTGDPEKDKTVKPIKQMTWQEYFKLVPPTWTPGAHYPVDVMAAKLAKKKDIKFIVAGGKNLANFQKILRGEKFKGTTLSNEYGRNRG